MTIDEVIEVIRFALKNGNKELPLARYTYDMYPELLNLDSLENDVLYDTLKSRYDNDLKVITDKKY